MREFFGSRKQGGYLIRCILLDLDGTLLPMDQERFTKLYFQALTRVMKPHRDPEILMKVIWAGTEAMMKNDGTRRNDAAFWEVYTSVFGTESVADEVYFRRFYENEFAEAREACTPNPAVRMLTEDLKHRGFRLILASNPLFPRIAQEQRLLWAGLDPADFDYISSYENSSFCKPSVGYYLEIAEACRVLPSECLMIGNDAKEDMSALEAGASVFLLTDCLIRRENIDLGRYPHGGFPELMAMLQRI